MNSALYKIHVSCSSTIVFQIRLPWSVLTNSNTAWDVYHPYHDVSIPLVRLGTFDTRVGEFEHETCAGQGSDSNHDPRTDEEIMSGSDGCFLLF